MKRRLQNKIAESSATFPMACAVATLLWWLPQGAFSWDYLYGWLACALTTLVLAGLVVVNTLLRVRSQMTSVVFVLTMGVCGFLHPIGVGQILTFFLVLAFYALFRSYEKREAPIDSFQAALCISLGSLALAPFLWLAPVLLVGQGIFMRGLSQRVLGAWLVGVVLPYWFWGAVALFLGDTTVLGAHLAAVIPSFQEPFYWPPSIEGIRAHMEAHRAEAAASAFVALTGTTGFIHYYRNNYDDKIGVRMCYYCLMLTQVVLLLWLLCQPTAFYQLFPLLILSTAPTAAHFFALAHTWLTNAWFVICCLALVGVGVCCLAPASWLPF